MLAFLLFLLYCRVYSDYRYDIIIKLSTPPRSFYSLFSEDMEVILFRIAYGL